MRWAICCGKSTGQAAPSGSGVSGLYESEERHLTIGQIDREHPDFQANRDLWKRYQDLYTGGERIRTCADQYLVRRHKEPGEVYLERLSRVFYENYVGSIIDWYAATLLRREPVLAVEGANESAKQFFNAFADDCDLKGTSLSDFFRQQLVNTLVYGRSYIALDF